ncbi:hypothetical protein ASF69_13805 [Rhizobium sp. Leaf311]|nr:hypothetical protein ASF69_13805 [Rhizobium sp. Leaf311]
MQLYAAGRRNEPIGMYRRILCWARNRSLRARYRPASGKLVARAVAFIMGLINATMGLLLIFIYGIGISLTMGDFFKTANLLWLKATDTYV